jgi:hypothetical protein
VPQMGFFVGGASVGVGMLAFIIAWDRYDRGPSRADNPVDGETDGCGLYSFVSMTTGAQLLRVKSKSPIAIPEKDCPETPVGLNWVQHFALKPIGTAFGGFPSLVFEIYAPSVTGHTGGRWNVPVFSSNVSLLYSAAPQNTTLIAPLAEGSFGANSEVSFQDQMTWQGWTDAFDSSLISTGESRELWRALMTPNQPLGMFDIFRRPLMGGPPARPPWR